MTAGQDGLRSYQLEIELPHARSVTVGRLGRFRFPAGRYVYTGSALKNIEARIARHLRREKCLRWHIDYLLLAPGTRVVEVRRLALPECECNQAIGGEIVAPGFGASDCRSGCISHLRYIGP